MMPKPILFETTLISLRARSQEVSAGTAQLWMTIPDPSRLHSALDVGRSAFDVFRTFSGRVAESGLRHSTRNRAWGNPPWVQIPPLPRLSSSFSPSSSKIPCSGTKNVTIKRLILADFAPHIVCPPSRYAIPCCSPELTGY